MNDYMQVNPVAPHFDSTTVDDFCIPEIRHLDLYQGLDPPSSPNKDIPLSPETPREVPENYALWKAQKTYRTQAQCLAGVDELVVGLIGELRDQGVLNNTYIIFTLDNGYHIGKHMLGQGKMMPYEEDVCVPLYIRGPNILEGQVSHYQAHMMDLPATLVELAGGIVPVEVDGISLPLSGLTTTTTTLRESVFSELWRLPNPYATAKYPRIGMPTVLASWMLVGLAPRWRIWRQTYAYAQQYFPTQRLLDRFNAVISVLATCRGSTCAKPYKLMHPAGTVGGLEDAMSAEHDELYAGLRRFQFLNCWQLYYPELELSWVKDEL
eukprot:gene24258-9858_t